jgi:hypothetical protein
MNLSAVLLFRLPDIPVAAAWDRIVARSDATDWPRVRIRPVGGKREACELDSRPRATCRPRASVRLPEPVVQREPEACESGHCVGISRAVPRTGSAEESGF